MTKNLANGIIITSPSFTIQDGRVVFTRVSDLQRSPDKRRESRLIPPEAVADWIPRVRLPGRRIIFPGRQDQRVAAVVEVSGFLAKNGVLTHNEAAGLSQGKNEIHENTPYTSWVVVAGPDHSLVSEALIRQDGEFLSCALDPLHAFLAKHGAVEGAWYRLLYCPWFTILGEGQPYVEVYFEPFNGTAVARRNEQLYTFWIRAVNRFRMLRGLPRIVPQGFIHDHWAEDPELERQIANMVRRHAGRMVAETVWNAWAQDTAFRKELKEQGFNLELPNMTMMVPPLVDKGGRVINRVIGKTVLNPSDLVK